MSLEPPDCLSGISHRVEHIVLLTLAGDSNIWTDNSTFYIFWISEKDGTEQQLIKSLKFVKAFT